MKKNHLLLGAYGCLVSLILTGSSLAADLGTLCLRLWIGSRFLTGLGLAVCEMNRSKIGLRHSESTSGGMDRIM